MPLHTFHGNNPHSLIQQFFLSIKRIDSIWKKWKLQDSNLWLVGYEPTALPTELSFLSRGLLQFKNNSSAVAILALTTATKGLRLLISAFAENPSGAFESPLIIPVRIDGTNSEGSYHHGK